MKLKIGVLSLLGLPLLCSSFAGIVSANNDGMAANGEGGLIVNEGMVAGIGVAGAKEGKDAKAGLIGVVKNFINWVLGILSLITLVLLLWGGFQMVTASGDDGKFQAGLKILKQAAIGLGFIALAWFMVSIIFWIIGNVGAGSGTKQ